MTYTTRARAGTNMNKWRKLQILILLMMCTVALFGCSRTRIIDKISIIHVFGFDQAKNGDIIGTALSPEYTKSKDSSQIKYLEEQADTSALVLTKMAQQTSTPIEIAKIRVIVIGQNFAEAGIQRIVNRFIITPQLGTHIQIAVSADSARKTLKTFKKEKSLTLAERLEHNMLGQSLPYMNLHYFLNNFYGEGVDAYVPMLTIDEKNRVKIDGIGVFKDAKFKLHLNSEQTILFSILEDYRNQATLKIPIAEGDSKESLTVRAFRSKPDWDWDRKKKQLNLRLHLKWTIVQYPGQYNIEKAKDIKQIKKIIVQHLEKELEELFATFKENEVDPLGVGNIVRSQDRTWEEESFYKQYPTLPINVNVDFKIIHAGLES